MNLVAFGLGALGWTLSEYLIHRFDGHGMKGKTPFSKEHLAHHRDPTYFAATWKKCAAAVAIATLMAAVLVPLLGTAGGVFTAGFVVMYATYEVIHRRIHTHAPMGPYGRWVRRHHLLHHHGNPALNHGVTTPIWDAVFRTWHSKDVVIVPPRRAPDWMRDPETGAVASDFAGDFVIPQR